jgi:hypothetical protein
MEQEITIKMDVPEGKKMEWRKVHYKEVYWCMDSWLIWNDTKESNGLYFILVDLPKPGWRYFYRPGSYLNRIDGLRNECCIENVWSESENPWGLKTFLQYQWLELTPVEAQAKFPEAFRLPKVEAWRYFRDGLPQLCRVKPTGTDEVWRRNTWEECPNHHGLAFLIAYTELTDFIAIEKEFPGSTADVKRDRYFYEPGVVNIAYWRVAADGKCTIYYIGDKAFPAGDSTDKILASTEITEAQALARVKPKPEVRCGRCGWEGKMEELRKRFYADSLDWIAVCPICGAHNWEFPDTREAK